MPFPVIRNRAVAAVFGVLLSACGGGDGSSVVSGTVLDHNQAAVANAEVLAVDRLTGREFSTLSDRDGRYSLVLPNGHYDMGSDDSGQHAAHMVLLRSLSDSDTTVDFVLPDDQDATQLSGQVFIRDGVPAANHRLVFSSNHHVSDEDPSLSMETTTDAQGRYTVSLGAQRLLDVDIYDPNGEFIEFVVLHKLDGALRADITLGDASDDNRHRHDHSVAAHDDAAVRPANESLNQPFRVTSRPISLDSFHLGLKDGKLPPDGSYLRIDEAAAIAFLNSFGQTTRETSLSEGLEEALHESLVIRSLAPPVLDLSVRADGGWWYDYAIHINTYDNTLLKHFYFTDETGDTYKKLASRGYHKLSYNSDAPSITDVGVVISNPPPSDGRDEDRFGL